MKELKNDSFSAGISSLGLRIVFSWDYVIPCRYLNSL